MDLIHTIKLGHIEFIIYFNRKKYNHQYAEEK